MRYNYVFFYIIIQKYKAGEIIIFYSMSSVIAPFHETKYLVVSSSFFLCPAYASYTNRRYTHTALFVSMSVISANFWRDARYGMRRDIDLFSAKAGLAISSLYRIRNLRDRYMVATFIHNALWIAYFYNMSAYAHNQNETVWVIYHILFHIITNFELYLCVKNIPPSPIKQK